MLYFTLLKAGSFLTCKERLFFNPFRAFDLFLWFLMFSWGLERDQWHEMG